MNETLKKAIKRSNKKMRKILTQESIWKKILELRRAGFIDLIK